jgi:hypothetical protein
MAILLSIFATSALVVIWIVYIYREDLEGLERSVFLDLAGFSCFISLIGIVFTSILNLITLAIGK